MLLKNIPSWRKKKMKKRFSEVTEKGNCGMDNCGCFLGDKWCVNFFKRN